MLLTYHMPLDVTSLPMQVLPVLSCIDGLNALSGFFNHSLVPLIADMLAGVRLCGACSMLTVPVAWYVEASVYHYEQWNFSLAAAGAVREVVYFHPAFFFCRLLDQVLERGLTWRSGEL